LIFAQSAKRSAPPVVIDVVYNNIRYTPSVIEKGYVEAWNTLNNQLIWKKKAYDIEYDPTLESDVQDILITRLKVENSKLVILNEKGDTYYIDLSKEPGFRVQNSVFTPKVIFFIIAIMAILSLGAFIYSKRK
jgi:hypothetical protein